MKKLLSIFFALVLVLTLGLVTAAPVAAATITVDDSGGADHLTIQAAINAAAPGDIINVAEGTYVEDLVIPDTKTNLELAGATGATIKGVQNVPIASWPLGAPNIEILADGVKIHGFTIQGPDYAAGFYASGIILDGLAIEIYDNDFVTTPAETAGEWAHAITTISKAVLATADVSGLYIHDNTFTGSGAVGSEFIYINPHTGTGPITIDNNQFSGSTNMGITAESGNVIVSNNTISTTLDPETLPYGTYGMRFMDTLYGANGSYDNIVVSGNDISGFKRAIRVGNGSQPNTSDFVGTISSNLLTNNQIGVWGRNGSQLVVVGNSIFDNTLWGILNGNGDDTPPAIDATGNWWGTTIEAEIQAMVSGDVTYTGWLVAAPSGVEIDAEVAGVTSVSPATGDINTTLEVVITGGGFIGATGVSFSGLGITVDFFTKDSDTQITAILTIAADAAAGARDVTVTVPEGPIIGLGLFSIIESLTLIAPSNISLGLMVPGSATSGQSATDGTVVTNVATWSVDAADMKVGNTGFMVTAGGDPLLNLFDISDNGSDYTDALFGITYTNVKVLPFYVRQDVSLDLDPIGSYAITITFTATY